MKVTIKSIAEAANVSRGTVDRVLNDRPYVNQEIRERVKRIAEEMGYQPNVAAKALALQKKPFKIGVLLLSEDDPNFIEIVEGVKRAAQEIKGFGITIEHCVMEEISVEEQIKCIRELQSKNISALAISPLDDENVRQELNKLSEEDIKIVTINTDIEGVDRMCFVGQDSKRAGRVAGDLLGKLFPKGGNILVVTGQERIKCLSERLAGFKEVLREEYPAVRIVDILQNENSNRLAYEKTYEVLKQRNDIDAIFITGRGIGGVGKAIQELQRRDIRFVCFDTIPETEQLLKDKVVDYTITQEPLTQGYLPIKILFEYFLNNKLPDSKRVHTKLEIRTRENLEV